MTIKNILASDAFWQVNKKIAKLTSNDAAVILSHLIDQFLYLKEKGMLSVFDGEEYFYCTAEQLQDACNVKRRGMENAISLLKEKGLIVTKVSGIPPRTFFKINEDAILGILTESQFVQNVQINLHSEPPICTKRTNQFVQNVQNVYNNNNKYNNNKLEKNTKKRNFSDSEIDEILSELWKNAPEASRQRSSRLKCIKALKAINTPVLPPKESLFEGIRKWKQSQKWIDGYSEGLHIWINDRKWEEIPISATSKQTVSKGIQEDLEIPT